LRELIPKPESSFLDAVRFQNVENLLT
jgi:hypothetical protein